MFIERKVDEAFAAELFADAIEDLPFFLNAARKDPRSLSSLMGMAWKGVSCGCVAQPDSPQIARALDIAANAHAALFAAAANQSGPLQVRLDDGEPVTYTSRPDESTVNVCSWIDAFYFNVLCRRLDSIELLCRTSAELVRRSTTKAGQYHYFYMEALQALGSKRLDTILDTLLAAIKATDPDSPDVFDPDWTLNLHVPQLEVLIYAVTKDAKFEAALTRAVQLHKKYWEKTKDRRRDYHGMISIELTALALIGRDRGCSFELESPYLPIDLASPPHSKSV